MKLDLVSSRTAVVLIISLIGCAVGLDRKLLAYRDPEDHLPAPPSVFPIVNKCCPLQQRWRDGKCVEDVGAEFQNGGKSKDAAEFQNGGAGKDASDFENGGETKQTPDSQNGGIPKLNPIKPEFQNGGRTETPDHEHAQGTSEASLMWEASMLEILENTEMDSNSTDNSTNTRSMLNDGPVVFRLRVSMPTCSSSPSQVPIEKIIHKEVLSKERMLNADEAYHSEDLEPSVLLSTEGYLIWKDENGFMNTHYNDDFCIDQVNDTAFIALVCQPSCDDTQPCIRKCCSPDSILDIEEQACLASKNRWSPYLYNMYNETTTFEPVSETEPQNPHYVYGIPNCDYYSFSPRKDPSDKMYALTNGYLVTMTRGQTIVYPSDSYCIDGATVGEDRSELDQIAIICLPDVPEESAYANFDYLRYHILAFSGLASSMFLFLTALVYLINWEYQNIHGWLQFAYVVSGLFSFFFLAIVQLFTDEIHRYSEKWCELMGTVVHFSFLSVFFWLTSMNFDLWWTFSGWRPLRPSSRNSDKRRFCFFALFSWGFSGMIAGIGFVLDHMYRGEPDAPIIRPRFGERKCYFFGYAEQLPYFYLPVGFLLIIDLLFFAHTVYSLQKLQKDTKFATQQSSRQDKKRFVLFMKIFIVMGVLWCFEVISWVIEVYVAIKFWEKLFLFFDVVNALQGLWIFVIFTCKPNTCRQLEGKFKKAVIYLEKHRDQNYGGSVVNRVWACLSIGFCTVLLPFLHLLRRMFSVCGRTTRSLENRRTVSHNTVTSNMFDKSRKFCDSFSSSITTTTDPGTYEMNPKLQLPKPSPPL